MRYLGKKDIAKIDRSLMLNAISNAYTSLLDGNTQYRAEIHVQERFVGQIGFLSGLKKDGAGNGI